MTIDLAKVKIEDSWKEVLKDEFLSSYFLEIKFNLINALKNGKVYPPSNLIFNAFNLTPFDKVKVVILGQDPYHNEGEAMGLSFSVPKGVRVPPSLANIYKEIKDDLGIIEPNCGDLSYWAKQGVLLLNATLSVGARMANSHSNFGWQIFSDAVIKNISEKKTGVVFMLWGNYARAKANLIEANKHLVLTAAHPSPLARGAFFGSRHFSKCNNYLIKNGQTPIDWDLNNYTLN
ncbi:uracil-DNA glycosylase [Campylobacter fetus]|uniref:Uracil-DNA glycosylase n=3 Tax=Campylobacter fetus TaxID=196 RepID=UNG_CAMFF|nr:uracil-DNA glycosylase [Campylobacter fetus]A0RM89.1 RecName: Full=Uracil-DNA glycosylase; Short=UDG [Campylobacter fetus subsp. fetus 82-40]OCS22536.1 uracil-DNA glycosylase [Campylobacter fetus subsp. venerealis cfvi97/532]OCS25716.1 uracil-DNA glycosylase [Campylobacter fetus subsp. venerealis cfvB10]OCS29931.1 uracil-DNA glycosylase [Campylobacter fetus subsp. venerealis LMG 6570 = CCUG 33900]OCS43183.1 uracil-DNA glycosylase [Campylobacter fetus subsp. venerealis cfvi02/298]ABK82941.1